MVKNDDIVKKLIHFFQYVSLDYENLPRRIVDGIWLYFGYNAVYSINKKLNEKEYAIMELYGDSIYARDHILYKEVWSKNDIFFNKLYAIVNDSKTMNKYAWRCQDLGCSIEEFWSQDLGKAIRKGGFGYKALITCGQGWYNMQHTISLYKPEKEGDFTDEEMSLFNNIGILFSIIQNNYIEKIENDQLKSVLDKHITEINGSFCVLNCQLNIVFQTHSFIEVTKQICNGDYFNYEIIPLVSQMADEECPSKNIITKEYKREKANYTMSISKFSGDYNVNYRSQYLYMINIEETKGSKLDSKQGQLDIMRKENFYQNVSDAYGLTRREKEVLELVMKGLSVSEISEEICVAESTAKTHINNLHRKLGVHSRSEAMAKIIDIKDSKSAFLHKSEEIDY